MKREEKAHRPNPKLTAGWLNRLFFGWLIPIFKEGNRHRLESPDLYEVLPENRSAACADRLEKCWNSELRAAGDDNGANGEKKRRKPSLLRAVTRTFLWSFLTYGVHGFVLQLVCKTVQPYLLGQLIRHFDEGSSASEAYGYATALVLLVVLDNALFSHMMLGLRSVGVSARVACASLLYRKIMRLPHSARQASGGSIVNLLANDSAKLEVSFLFSHTVWILPAQAIVVTYLICRGVGWLAGLAGVLSLILQTIPVQSFSARLIARYRRRIAGRTDERLLLTDEIVRAIRVIKMHGWEAAFERLLGQARRREIDAITASSYLKSMLWATFAFAQRVPLFVAVTIHALQTGGVSAFTLFTTVQYFNVLHVTMGSYFLRSVSLLSEAVASIRRMQEFLLLEERSSHVKRLPRNNMDDAVVSLSAVSANCAAEQRDVLREVTLDLRRGRLYAVAGPVGAGKSSLLKLILDELRPSRGQAIVYGSVSYASQEPWIFKATLRDNVLFGEPYEPKRYQRVIKACALEQDLELLPRGDETLVGEGGANLSGGQCARIGLARAVYKEADVYLLDDPFSAVDGRVGRVLFDECVNGLLRDKTRLVVSQQARYLRDADEVILVDNGRIEFQGGFDKLRKSNEYSEYLSSSNANEAADDVGTKESLELAPRIEDVADETEKLLPPKQEAIAKTEEGKRRENGAMYWEYFTASGSRVYPLATLLAFVGSQLLCSGCDYFVAYWTRKQDRSSLVYNSTSPRNISHAIDSYTAIYVFGGFIAAIVALSIAKSILFTATCRRANENLHSGMAASLLRASVRFFDLNDSGRILNRFSKDLGTVDERLQGMMLEALEYVLTIVGVALQIVLVNRWSALLILPMGYLYWRSRRLVIETMRNIMRLEAQAKSPVFAHVNSSLAGIATIRSRDAQAAACREFDARQDEHTAAAAVSQYALIAYNHWLDWITLLLTVFLAYSFVLLKDERTAGADVGLAMTQVIVLCGVLARGIKLSGDIETQMVSVERLFEYTRLEREEDGDSEPASSWPSRGEVAFEDVSLRYARDHEPVLKNLQFTIGGSSKVGVVGRTGAGKSSLIAALFRLAEIDGSIRIDDLDTRKVPLRRLRSEISILPQEPQLFSVSLRRNLDPLGEFDDATLWSVLRDVELSGAFDSLDRTLERDGLSSGQRQLLCLARTILRRRRILILDEVTANVDPSTTALIQRAIRAKFEDCTVMMIAHRLNTVLDCDRILVMERGRVVEYDSPGELLKRNDGYFARMMAQYGSIKDEISKEK